MAFVRCVQAQDERDLIPKVSRSAEPYVFTPTDDKDAIFAAVTYCRPQHVYKAHLDPTLSDPVRSSLTSPFPRDCHADLGKLSTFPLEILVQILLFFPLPTLLQFRNTNQRARIIVSTIPEYRLITTHALPTLQALFHTLVAPHLTLSSLTSLLRENHCSACNTFGMYLHLPTLQRSCNRCYYEAPILNIIPLTPAQLPTLPPNVIVAKCLRSIYTYCANHPDDGATYEYLSHPGRPPRPYIRTMVPAPSPRFGRYVHRPLSHADREVIKNWGPKEGPVYLISPALFPTDHEAPEPGWREQGQSSARWESVLEFPHLEVLKGGEVRIDGPRSCKGCDIGCNKTNERSVEMGLPNQDGKAHELRRRVWGWETYWEHFAWCRDAQGLWRAANKGEE